MWGYAFLAAIFIASVGISGAVGYGKGSASRNPEIAELTAAIEVSKRLAAEADDRAAKASAQVVTVYKDRVKVIREEPRTEIIERVVREADPNCVLPPSLRELWDSPASSGGEAAKDSARVDGPPVTVAELTQGIDKAKRAFDENAAKLESIQSLINAQ